MRGTWSNARHDPPYRNKNTARVDKCVVTNKSVLTFDRNGASHYTDTLDIVVTKCSVVVEWKVEE